MWVTPDSDSFCSESDAADAPAGGKASPPPHEASFTGGGVGGGRFAARTVAVRSYPHVRSSPHLPYNADPHRAVKLVARFCYFVCTPKYLHVKIVSTVLNNNLV